MKWFTKREKKYLAVEEELQATETADVEEASKPETTEEPIVNETPAVEEVSAPAEAQATPVEEKPAKVFIVNCNKCGAALRVKDGAYAYICGSCNNLFQIRKMEKIVQEAVLVQDEEPVAPVEETANEDVQLDINDIPVEPVVEEPIAEEMPVEETVEAEETPVEEIPAEEPATEEALDETPFEESVEEEKYAQMPEWSPKTDDGEEDGWDEEEDRHSELPVWQEEEEEEGWDEEE